MAEFRQHRLESVNVFAVDGQYLFKHYFDSDAVFDRLKRYYNNQQYRFEVPRDRFESLRSFLAEHGYELVEIEDTTPFVVVVEQYSSHPDNIFKAAVVQRTVDGYNAFLLRDQAAVEQAVHGGAARLEATDLPNPF